MSYRRVLNMLTEAAVLVLAGLWVYSPAYHGDWLWDDDLLVTHDDDVQSGSLAGLFRIWADPERTDFFPLTSSLFWLESLLFGMQPTGFHVTSIMLHVASGLLLWRLLTMMKVPGAWAAALAFTIHPACVESVAWIAETKNTLSLPLCLAACIFWVGQDDEEPGPKRQKFYLLSLAFFLLGMLAKTSFVAMPVLTLLYAWWKRGTVTRQDVVRAAPMFLISVVLGIITIRWQSSAIGTQALNVGGVDSRFVTAGLAIVFYLATIVWPVQLLPIYPRWEVDPPKIWQFLPWLLIGGATWWLWKNRHAAAARHAIFALGFFLLTVAPVLGFIDISYMRISWVADHFLYVPMIGPLTLIVAAAAAWLGGRPERQRTILTGVAAGVMLLLALNSFLYSIRWMDEAHLWEYTLARNYGAWAGHSRLGQYKLDRGDVDGACEHFQHAARLRPDLSRVHTDLGLALLKRGSLDEAIKSLQAAVQAAPDSVVTRTNLADGLSQVGRYAEARALYEEVMGLGPVKPLTLSNYGIVLFKLGEADKAVAEFKRALALDPDLQEARENLKVALEKSAAQPTPDKE
jgi:tetratricopeptide (TPR) repeat protein